MFGELFMRTLSTTLLQIFSKFMLNSKVIFKRMTSPDDRGMKFAKISYLIQAS